MQKNRNVLIALLLPILLGACGAGHVHYTNNTYRTYENEIPILETLRSDLQTIFICPNGTTYDERYSDGGKLPEIPGLKRDRTHIVKMQRVTVCK